MLYTISRVLIKANDLNSLDEINKVELPYENYYPKPMNGIVGHMPMVEREVAVSSSSGE